MTDPMARMLGINLSTRHWGNKRKSRQAEARIDTEFGSSGATDVRKYLIPRHHLARPEALISALYRTHYKLTLPWQGKLRVIPADVFFNDYRPIYKKIEKEFEDWFDQFLISYPHIVQGESERMLNTLFNPSDYPTVSEMRQKFAINVVVMPVPTANDFRIDAIEEYVDELKADWNENLTNQGRAAQDALWERLAEPIEPLCNAHNRKRFDESLVSNILESANLARRLNVFGDNMLDAVTEYILDSTPSIDKVKDDPQAAAELGKKFKKMVENRTLDDDNKPVDIGDINDRMAFWAQ